jgi:hypothetical protein
MEALMVRSDLPDDQLSISDDELGIPDDQLSILENLDEEDWLKQGLKGERACLVEEVGPCTLYDT